MKAWMLLLFGVAVLALSLGATATACGGGGNGQELTLEEYFRKIEDLRSASEQKSNDIEAGLDESLISAQSVDELSVVLGEAMTELRSIRVALRNDLVELRPPADAEGPHNDMVSALNDGIELVEDLDSGGMTSVANLIEFGSTVEEQLIGHDEEIESACVAMQAVADENNVDVNLDCGSGEE